MSDLTPDQLSTPPTEQEIAAVLLLLNNKGCVESAKVLRRLVFQRDKLKEEVSIARQYSLDSYYGDPG